jgi:hypothetical protein
MNIDVCIRTKTRSDACLPACFKEISLQSSNPAGIVIYCFFMENDCCRERLSQSDDYLPKRRVKKLPVSGGGFSVHST